jgi:hypothetical protein
MAPDLFSDGFASVQTEHGLVRITLASWRHDYSRVALLPDEIMAFADLNCVCVGRLVMLVGAAKKMAATILRLLEPASASPIDPDESPDEPTAAPVRAH